MRKCVLKTWSQEPEFFSQFYFQRCKLREVASSFCAPFLMCEKKAWAFTEFRGSFTLWYIFLNVSWQTPVTWVVVENWRQAWGVSEGIFKQGDVLIEKGVRDKLASFYNSMLREEANVMGGDSIWWLSDIHDAEQKCQSWHGENN